MMLMYLYYLKMIRKDVYFTSIYWKARYLEIGLDNG